MIKLLTIVGARPQFIKAAALSRTIAQHYAASIEEIIVHTGQHYDHNMSTVFFEELKIPKEHYNLGIGSGSHAEQTAKAMVRIEETILQEKPEAVLVYGDTNSTLAASLAAAKLHVPLIHVEAGVRTGRKRSPEEINRIVCDHCSTLLFVPTRTGIESLLKEGFVEDSPRPADMDSPKIFCSGDVMYDNTLFFRDVVAAKQDAIVDRMGLKNERFVLATLHRPTNVDKAEVLLGIFEAFAAISKKHGLKFIVPIHPRGRAHLAADEFAFVREGDWIQIIDPVSFLDMISLESHAELIATDSGGVQKEAYFVERPCLVLNPQTAWVELLEAGSNILAGNKREAIEAHAETLLSKRSTFQYPPIFGDGKASNFICDTILETFS